MLSSLLRRRGLSTYSAALRPSYGLWIDGAEVDSVENSDDVMTVVCPTDQRVLARTQRATAADVEALAAPGAES